VSRWYDETLYSSIRQSLKIDRLLFRGRSKFQHVAIFENAQMGRVLALDGVIQTSSRDEHVYHEMLTHLPMLAHGAVKNVLIIGGGDGGVLREALRHPIEHAVMVEIDGVVVEQCQKHMPELCGEAYRDKRAELIIGDGIKFMAETKDKFDLIVVDSTDPFGPAEGLFGPKFYADVRRALAPRGIVMCQTGVPVHQDEELLLSQRKLKRLFKHVGVALAVVPLYYGGFMALSWASSDFDPRRVAVATVAKRYKRLKLTTRYYAPALQVGAYAHPHFIADIVARA